MIIPLKKIWFWTRQVNNYEKKVQYHSTFCFENLIIHCTRKRKEGIELQNKKCEAKTNHFKRKIKGKINGTKVK